MNIKAKYCLTDDVVSTVGAGVMLEQPGVHTFLMKPVSTRDNSQLLWGDTHQDTTVRYYR